MKKEIWKDIPKYEGLYQASNYGRIKSLDKEWYTDNIHTIKVKGKVLKQNNSKNGYKQIQLNKNGIGKTYSVHRIILKTFIYDSSLHCNHKNGIKTDNNLENLEYVTPSENGKHAYLLGLSKTKKGEESYLNKYPKDIIIYIKSKINNNEIKSRGYWSKLSKETGVSPQNICHIIHGRSWAHL